LPVLAKFLLQLLKFWLDNRHSFGGMDLLEGKGCHRQPDK